MKLAMKTLRQFLMKKRNIENWKKALEWWIVKEEMLKKVVWFKKAKKKLLMKSLSAMKFLITVWNNMYKMKSKCRRDTENINPRVSNKSNGRTIVLS